MSVIASLRSDRWWSIGAIALAIGLVLWVTGAAGQSSDPVEPPPLYDVETFTLDNGLEVVVVQHAIGPVVHHMMWYDVGAADEPPGQSGIAHFLEHLMFKGTEAHPDRDFSVAVRQLGGRDNAFTSWDVTVYHQTIARDRLAEVMALEAERMRGLQLDPAEVLTERDVIIEERRERIDNDPASQLSVQVGATLFQNHPYGTPIIGWEQEMAALDLEAVRAFYDAWYAPNNGVLVVVGDIDAETLRPLAEQAYGAIAPRPLPERVRPMEPEHVAPRRVEMEDPAVRRTIWRRHYLAPSYYGWRVEAAPALDVAVELFGATTSSRLYEALVVDRGLAANAGAFFSTSTHDYGQLILYVIPRQGVDVAALEQAIDDIIAETLAEGFTQEEVDRAAESLITSATLAADSLTTPGRIFGRAVTGGLPVEDVLDWPDDIRAVTPQTALETLASTLDINRSVTGVLRPADGAADTAMVPP